MPKKQVTQYTCERCARVWYLDSTAPEPATKLNLLLELGRAKDSPDGAAIQYECLCNSCSDTVRALVKSLAPLKPRQPRAKKKDESMEGKPPIDPTATTDAAPAASSPPGPASAGGSSGAAGTRPAPSAPPHPRR